MVKYNKELKTKASKIKWIFTDVDGTLTDGCVYYSPVGEAMKKFSLIDGAGHFLLQQAGFKTGIITGENSPIVELRSKKLKVDALIMNAVPKHESLHRFIKERDLDFNEIAYIGDDLNDIKLLKLCGLSFVVGNASFLAKEAADIVCESHGGNGAYREVAEMILLMNDIDIQKIVDNKL